MKEKHNFKVILEAFGLDFRHYLVQDFGVGLINSTFVLKKGEATAFVLQRINTKVFPNPQLIASNWSLAHQYLKITAPNYFMPLFQKTQKGADFFVDEQGNYWRLLPFIKDSSCFETAPNIHLAKEAANAFGHFAALLSGAPLDQFNVVLPGFHDLKLRQQQFDAAVENASEQRLLIAAEQIEKLNAYRWITDFYNRNIGRLPVRIVHMDAKISNILFDSAGKKVKCIIDMDTLMPGTLLSDFGDLIRSMVCEAAEDETDVGKIVLRHEMPEIIFEGYTAALEHVLEPLEKEILPFGGPMLIYMQALRFLADYLSNDVYYPVRYQQHNLDRAWNQIIILEKLLKEPFFAKQGFIP
ncbi:MAG: phosphotransferase [Bacteroidales bacterium]|nr:phosphotransferase [Bacteroidales bacterium]